MRLFIITFFLCVSLNAANWGEGVAYPVDGNSNPYNFNAQQLEQYKYEGLRHALHYPVDVTGLLLPLDSIESSLDNNTQNDFKHFLNSVVKKVGGVKSFDHFQSWLGLHPFPKSEGEGPYMVPQQNIDTHYRMGLSIIEKNGSKGFTFSCATCHSANLFGKRVMGLTNRFPRANHLFVKAKKIVKMAPSGFFKLTTGATEEERLLYKRAKKNLKYVESRMPIQLGLDTSLSHVALSLSRRSEDEYATKNPYQLFPRKEKLRTQIADSKPGVWWNVKYKNRWLLDGAVVSGNPILTNILWNEIGRGTDLKELETWMDNNEKTIQELTTAVFSAEAPHITDFVSESYFNINRLKNGQKIFESTCTRCHGYYDKNWDQVNANGMTWRQQLKTYQVRYPEQTPVVNVGTDPLRWQGISSLEQLNHLAISKRNHIKVKAQNGYVPPPLVGIWARWPYFHNNAIPNLCALVTAPENRPSKYYAGEALDIQRDFDMKCNGYPTGPDVPNSWKKKEFLFDTSKKGKSNSGHYKMFLDKEGNEKFTFQEKMDLIHYLQTL